jgi:hypothetical protein
MDAIVVGERTIAAAIEPDAMAIKRSTGKR